MLNDYRQIISALRNSVWYIVPESLDTILEIVNMRLNGTAFSDDEIRIRLQEVENGDRDFQRVEVGGGIGIIPLYGPIFPKSNLMTELSGATSLETFTNDLNSLLNNDAVKNIVLDIDSPGGVDSMIPETAQLIREAREIKPINAVANTMAGSAAHYLAAQATKFYASPSAKVGSIGAYIVHEDVSRKDEAEGRKITFISSGKFKTAGNEHEPLSAEALEYVQGFVTASHEQFMEDVAIGRGTSLEAVREYGDGRIFGAKVAADMGIIDGVKSLTDLVGDLVMESQPQVQGVLSNVLNKHQKALEVANKSGIVVNQTTNVPKEGRMNEAELRQRLGLAEDADINAHLETLLTERTALRETLELDENGDLVESVKGLQAELAPIKEVQSEATKLKNFAETFPAEYAEMQALREKRLEGDAESFAARYERFSKKDGDKEVKSNLGFPAVTLNKIQESHKAISGGSFTHSMLETLLDLVTQNGFVDFAEHGSSRREETHYEDPIKQFASRVSDIMTKDNIKANQATKMAIKQWPEEYEAYREAQARKSNTTA